MTSRLKRLLIPVCFLLLPISTLAQSTEATQIKIVSAWGGLGPAQDNELIITRNSSGYRTGGKQVEARLVTNLLNALNAPAVSKIDLANLGITPAWLDANAEKGVKKYADFYYSTAAPN